jgi:sigma-B regulation protein RsbU (phosphoserine phosphatase)
MEQDLKAARRVQSIFLPRRADLEGLEIAIGWRPAREVSGDLYDFFDQTGKDVIAFGDSSGKGAAAALYGALVSGLLRTLAPRIKTPAALMKRLNEILLERRVDAQYVTLLLMHWDKGSRTITMANAGGPVPMICRNGERVKISVEGIPLGLLEERDYDEVDFKAKRGDVMVLFSDGVQDQLNSSEEEYGTSRLFRVLKDVCGRPPKDIVDAMFVDIDHHREQVPLTDDQTLIVLKVQ